MQKNTQKRVLHTLDMEISALSGMRHAIDKNFYKSIDVISNRAGKIVITGVGKSGFIGMKMSATLTSLGHGSLFLHPVDALHGDSGIVDDGDIVVAISSSGETAEIVKIIRYLKKNFSVKIFTITANKNSSLAKLSDGVFHAAIKSEGSPLGFAPMASTTAALAMGDIIASALTSPEKFKREHFAKFHPAGNLGLTITLVKEVMVRNVPIVKKTASLEEAFKAMTRKKQGTVAVLGLSGKIEGVITDGDIRRFMLKHKSIIGKTAANIMSTHPKTAAADLSLKEALRKMEDFKITSLFVVDKKNKPIGILHIHSIIEDFVV